MNRLHLLGLILFIPPQSCAQGLTLSTPAGAGFSSAPLAGLASNYIGLHQFNVVVSSDTGEPLDASHLYPRLAPGHSNALYRGAVTIV
jgi:hypothetical protein